MKDILGKLTEIEASAPKAPARKKTLTEDTTVVTNKKPSLKDVFNELSENVAPGQKPLPVLDPQKKQAGMGFVTSTNPSVQNMLKNLDPKDVQIVQAPGQPGQTTTQPNTVKPVGTTGTTPGGQGQAMGAGQQQVQEKWGEETTVSPSEKGKYAGKTKAELTSQYNKLKASGPHTKGSPEFGKMRELSFAIRAKSGWGKVQEEQLDEKLTKSMSAGDVISDFEKSKDPKFKGKSAEERKKMALGAYYGMHPEKSKKKTTEGDIPSSAGVDTKGAGLGAGRSQATLEGKMGYPFGYPAKREKGECKECGTVGKHEDDCSKYRDTTAGRSQTTLEGIDPEIRENQVGKILKKLQKIPGFTGAHDQDGQRRVAEFIFDKLVQGMSYNQALVLSHRINEGKWDYPEHMKKTVTTSDMGTTNAQRNREERKAFRKKEKAKAHTELMKGGKKVEEGKKPDFLDLDKDGDKKEPMKKAVADKKKKIGETSATKAMDYLSKSFAPREASVERSARAAQYNPGDRKEASRILGNRMKGAERARDVVNKSFTVKETENIDTTVKKKVKESMNHRINAARLEGRSHGLRGNKHCGKTYEDLDEMRAYHEGYKEGLDECYGQGVYETAMPATVGGMADEEMLGELSPATLGSYVGKASASMHDLAGDEAYLRDPRRGFGSPEQYAKQADQVRGKAEKRHQGITTAVGKLTQPAMEDEFDEGNAFTAALARTPKGGKFSVGGKTFTDRSGYDSKLGEGDFAFESWDNQLKALINESEVNEGLSVSISKGQQNTPDSVTITAQDQEAENLLAFVKNAGLGLFGDDQASPSSAMSVQPAHGAPDEVGASTGDLSVVDGHDGMMGLMQKLSGIQSDGAEDYADEEGEEECGSCNECGGMMEQGHSCGSKEMVDEVESEDQMEFEVAEDNAPDSGATDSVADENAEAAEDSALAKSDLKGGTYTVNEEDEEEEELDEAAHFKANELSNAGFKMVKHLPKLGQTGPTTIYKHSDTGSEVHAERTKKGYDFWSQKPQDTTQSYHKNLNDAINSAIKEELEEEEEVTEGFTFESMYKRLDSILEGSDDEPKNPKHKKDDAEDEDEDSEDLKEWANQVGGGEGKGTDAQFTQDIDFMTKVIAGGLNKPKSTGQTTVPVIAGQDTRMHDNPMDWATLAGIKK